MRSTARLRHRVDCCNCLIVDGERSSSVQGLATATSIAAAIRTAIGKTDGDAMFVVHLEQRLS